MPSIVRILSFLSLAIFVSAIPSDDGDTGTVDISNPLVPFIDYEGIAAAAENAVTDDLVRRGLLDDSALLRKRNAPRCQKINKRQEWRTLSKADKKAYIKAVKCLANKPDYGISDISSSLYDAFIYIHQVNWWEFHGCAPFPPWHRWFVWLREVSMREVCGYDGPVPYWNYTMDYQNPFGSPIFSSDPETGFGTHGTTPYLALPDPLGGAWGYKVDNGAFAGWKVNLPEPHYLTRNFSWWKASDPTGQYGTAFGNWMSPAQVQKTLEPTTFWDFEIVLDGLNAPQNLGIHNAPHFNNGGDWYGPGWTQNTSYFPWASTAPNDPMFFPHHAYVDSVFWKWQQKPGNQYKYNGATNFTQLTVDDAKATDILPMSGFGPSPPVALALKTEDWPLCYTY